MNKTEVSRARELIWEEAAKISELIEASVCRAELTGPEPWHQMTALDYRAVIESAFAILRAAILEELRPHSPTQD